MNLDALLLHAFWKYLDRHVARREARRYIAKTFRPSHKRHPRSVYGLKHDFEQSAGPYINEDDYTDSLRRCGLRVADGRVYAKEIHAM